MACIWILFVSVFFCVFSEGAPIDEALTITDMDISNTEIAYRSLYEEEEEVNKLSLLNGDGRNKNSIGPVNMENSKVLSSKLWRSSGKPAIDNDDEAEKEPILNYIPITFKDGDSVEVAVNTVSYDDIVHIGPANYKMETANVNVLNTRRERATETTESSEEDVFDVDGSISMNKMKKTMMELDENNVPNIGWQIFLNKVIFRVQLKMEYDTDNIPPDIKTDGILESLDFKRSPAEVEKNIAMHIDRKPVQEKQITQSNGYTQESKYNPNDNVELKSIVEYSTEYTIPSRDMHTEEVSIDIDATTDTENDLDESPMQFGKRKAIKISFRSNFADDYPTISDETSTDEVDTNESSSTEPGTEAETTQHHSFPSDVSRDIPFGETPKLGGAEAVIEKRLEMFMFMEMGLAIVIIISSVTTIIQVIVLVKKLKGMRNKYECTAVPLV